MAIGVWMLAGLTRGICIPLAVVAMTWVWFEQGNKLVKAAASLALLLGILGPLAGRSWSLARVLSPNGIASMVQLYHRAGTLGFSIDFHRTDGGSGRSANWTYGFTSPAVLQRPLEPLSDWRTRREGEAHFSIDLDAGSRDWQKAMDSLPPWSLTRAAWLTGDNLVHLFFSESWPDTNRNRIVGNVNYWLRWIWVPLAALCLVWTLARWRQVPERLFPVLLLTWFVVQGLFPLAVNEGRYRKPFEGMLIVQCLLLASGMRRRQRMHQTPAEAVRAAPA